MIYVYYNPVSFYLLDRILLVAWLKKLRSCMAPEISLTPQLRIEYARYLLVALEADKSMKRFPFNELPPRENAKLKGLLPCLADYMIQKRILCNEVGPLHPIISHKSDDGRAIVAVERSAADGTLLCYLSVSRDKHK